MRHFLIASAVMMPVIAHASTAEQRGFEVYRQVCSTCHGMEHLTFVDLAGIGISPRQIRDYAQTRQIPDGLDDTGEPQTRAATPMDHMVSPYASEAMARAANHGSMPPDLSRRAITQRGGTAWIVRMLQSYRPAPEGFHLPPGSFYNTAMPHGHIGMPQPLHDGQIVYADMTPASVRQMATDMGAFLDWAAHPHQQTRHRVGVIVLLYLAVMTALVLRLRRRIWKGRRSSRF